MPLNRTTPMHERCDILIIGAGPAGMAAALAADAGVARPEAAPVG